MNDDYLKALIEAERRKLEYRLADYQTYYKTHEKTTATVVPIDPPEGYGEW
jgi:hypothetical protein